MLYVSKKVSKNDQNFDQKTIDFLQRFNLKIEISILPDISEKNS